MRHRALGVLAGLVLAILAGSNVAVASPPVSPQITDITVRWGMIEWDDGVARCTLVANAVLDPGFTKGPPVYAHAYVHSKWVVDGVGTWQEWDYWHVRLARGDTTVHTYTAFLGDGGYYVVDQVRVDLTSVRGEVLSTWQVGTANTCMNG